MAQPAVPPTAPAPRPGWTTTEFWTTVLVHVMGIVAIVLVLVGRDGDLEALEALVPVIALVISGAVNFAYSHARARAKLDHVAGHATVLATDLARIRPLLESDAKVLEPLAEILDPGAMRRLRAASEAWQKAEAK